MGRAIFRRRFLRQGDGELVIAENLTIAAELDDHGGRDARVRRLRYPGGARGLPQVPIYQRTYGAG